MFDKIKRAISGWGQDSSAESSPRLRPGSPLPRKKDKDGLKSSNSLRVRLRSSIYRRSSSSSSSEVLPLPPPKCAPDLLSEGLCLQGTAEAENGAMLKETPVRASALVDPRPIPALTDAAPKSPYIRRTSSFPNQRASSESNHDDARDDDIIIFSSTPPVTIARSSSVKIPRTGATAAGLHKGSPDQAAHLASSTGSQNQDTPVVQWPRGGVSSAASRSQEHFMRCHRRTSTSSDASLKDTQPQMATTPPLGSAPRQDLSQRPSLDRQYSRSGSTHAAVPTAMTASSSVASVQDSPASKSHRKTPSNASAESNASADSHGVPRAAAAALMAPSASNVLPSPSLDQTQQHADSEPFRDSEASAKTTPTDVVPALNPFVAKQLELGTQMLKISAKKQHIRTFKLDLEQGRILWDSRKFGRINVEQIKELRKGKAARMYREQLRVQPEHEERWLTIIYSAMGKYKALHLVAPTKDTYQDWIMAVERMWSVKREVAEGLPQLQRKTNQWLKEHWMDADKNVDSKLGYEEVVRLCHRLNINFSRKEIRLRFDQADEKKQGFLDFADFTHFVKLLKERKEVIQLFFKIAKEDPLSMTVSEFTRFMLDIQKSSYEKDHIKEIYNKHRDKTVEKFTVDSLTSFLLSTDNSVVSPFHTHVHQDMSQTLSNYYISSSHNTYLLGHQLTGISSIEGYIRALQSGCRCVELDCWDGADGQPVIYHGRTLTSKILFRDVIEAISTYAFVNSPYPLILSLEIHCDLDQQEIMANIMRSKLGSWLVVAPLDSGLVVLPSPDDLKFKILVKSKVLPPDAVAQEFSTDTESESERESESDSDGVKSSKPKTKSKKIRIARALSDITIYCQSRHFPGFSHDGCSPHKIISFSERVSLRMCKQSLQDYINMNKSHLTRVYPAGFRINSTNYDPHHHWAAGAQVVALNYQSYDRGMQMNSAMFRLNGHCGYVLKPQPLRLGAGEVCNHDRAPAFSKAHPVDITIELISAQQLPRPNEAQTGDVVDPVCEIELLVPGQSSVKYKTHHVSDNGFNPVWQQSFVFRVDYEHHELVFFRFVVQDEDIKFSDLIASYCISLDCLQEGYRHIPLHGPSGDPYFVHVYK
ncbi:Phospholipase C [Mortierella antarctica]|nr:Phospholipase C [Mortierella antarctica]